MPLYLVSNAHSKAVKAGNGLIVAATSVANARLVAAAAMDGDGSWAGATVTELVGTRTLADVGSCAGYRFVVWIDKIGAAPVKFEYTGTATDALDDVAAALVLLFNAHASIAAAAYAAPNLTVAGVADGLGDQQVRFYVYPPEGGTGTDLAPVFHTAITDGGIAAAALVIALVADTVILPEVQAGFKA